jgi:formylmethanofuran dehydrogenase subunit E-like metal-binding protein
MEEGKLIVLFFVTQELLRKYKQNRKSSYVIEKID